MAEPFEGLLPKAFTLQPQRRKAPVVVSAPVALIVSAPSWALGSQEAGMQQEAYIYRGAIYKALAAQQAAAQDSSRTPSPSSLSRTPSQSVARPSSQPPATVPSPASPSPDLPVLPTAASPLLPTLPGRMGPGRMAMSSLASQLSNANNDTSPWSPHMPPASPLLFSNSSSMPSSLAATAKRAPDPEVARTTARTAIATAPTPATSTPGGGPSTGAPTPSSDASSVSASPQLHPLPAPHHAAPPSGPAAQLHPHYMKPHGTPGSNGPSASSSCATSASTSPERGRPTPTGIPVPTHKVFLSLDENESEGNSPRGPLSPKGGTSPPGTNLYAHASLSRGASPFPAQGGYPAGTPGAAAAAAATAAAQATVVAAAAAWAAAAAAAATHAAVAAAAASAAAAAAAASGMSQTLRSVALVPPTRLSVALPEHVRNRLPAPAGAPRRVVVHDQPEDELVNMMLGTYHSRGKSGRRSVAAAAQLRPDAGVLDADTQDILAASARRITASGLPDQIDILAATAAAQGPAPAGREATFPVLRPRTPRAGFGDFLISGEYSFAGSQPLRHTAVAPGVLFEKHNMRSEEQQPGPVQSLYLRRHRLGPDLHTVAVSDRVAVVNPRSLPNGIPVSRLTALKDPSAFITDGQLQPASSAPSQPGPLPHHASGSARKRTSTFAERKAALSAAEAQSDPTPVTLHHYSAEPLLDDHFYGMVQAHFVALADMHQHRLQVQLNASLPDILESFGCGAQGFDRLKKSGPYGPPTV